MRPDWLAAAEVEALRSVRVLGIADARTPRVAWNEKLRTIAGRYLGRANRIELNPHYCLEFGLVEVVATVRHEVCHIGLRPGTALRHATETFRKRLGKLGAPNHCLPMRAAIRRSRVRYRYECPSCRMVQVYRRRIRGLACRSCCDTKNGGRYDRRFRLCLVGEARISAVPRPLRPTGAAGPQLALFPG